MTSQAQFDFAENDGEESVSASAKPLALRAWRPADWRVAADWRPIVKAFLETPKGLQLAQRVQVRLDEGAVIYPSEPFLALALTPLSEVRVVILGQDPYHGAGQAHGLAFSVAPGARLPPSLRNVVKEIAGDPDLGRLPGHSQASGSLVGWADQGVLLLNTCLTVEQGQPASHANWGWEVLTDALIQAVAQLERAVVFMLWGAHAQAKRPLIERVGGAAHLILCANHPSPLSARRPPVPFLGCAHFSQANRFLGSHGGPAIDWSIAG